MELEPEHYKHGQFLCLSLPPCCAQREGVARANIRRCVPPSPSPAGSNTPKAGYTGGWLWGVWMPLGFYGGEGSKEAVQAPGLRNPVWVLSSSHCRVAPPSPGLSEGSRG